MTGLTPRYFRFPGGCYDRQALDLVHASGLIPVQWSVNSIDAFNPHSQQIASIVLVSGRASYEILQKCLAAAVPVVCSVSAPSSLAVSLAEQFGMTLVGFLRGERFNIYAGAARIARP